MQGGRFNRTWIFHPFAHLLAITSLSCWLLSPLAESMHEQPTFDLQQLEIMTKQHDELAKQLDPAANNRVGM